MTSLFRGISIEKAEDVPVQYVGVYTMNWHDRPDQPEVAFYPDEQATRDAGLGAKVREAVLAECSGKALVYVKKLTGIVHDIWAKMCAVDRDGLAHTIEALQGVEVILGTIADALEAESKPVEIDGFEEAE